MDAPPYLREAAEMVRRYGGPRGPRRRDIAQWVRRIEQAAARTAALAGDLSRTADLPPQDPDFVKWDNLPAALADIEGELAGMRASAEGAKSMIYPMKAANDG